MSSFEATKKRLKNIHARMPDFPEDLMRLMRMTYHIQKRMKDLSNAALRKYDLVDASYMVLAVLYGSDNETSTASNGSSGLRRMNHRIGEHSKRCTGPAA